MAAELAGGQRDEGGVSCSVVRRIALPGAFLAADGILTALRGSPDPHPRSAGTGHRI